MDPETLRADIPALAETTYLNTGAASPSPGRVVAAVEDCVASQQFEAPAAEGPYVAADAAREAARERVAEFLGAAPADLALTNSTADGIARVASAIDWAPGDAVVRTDLEHPAGTLPWATLARTRDVEVRVVETTRGRLDDDALDEKLEGARLVCFSSHAWNYGTRLPVADLVERAREAGALTLVDAVQSVGQHPVDVTEWGADFVAGAGHKWLLGPWGAGYLYVRPDAAETLSPRSVSYRSVTDPQADDPTLKPGAQRLEVGTTSPAPYAGLAAGIDALTAVGLDAVQSRVARLTDRLKAGVPDDRLLSPDGYESGLVTIRDEDPERTVERLGDAGVTVRPLPDPTAIRASVHVFNTAGDVDAFLDAL